LTDTQNTQNTQNTYRTERIHEKIDNNMQIDEIHYKIAVFRTANTAHSPTPVSKLSRWLGPAIRTHNEYDRARQTTNNTAGTHLGRCAGLVDEEGFGQTLVGFEILHRCGVTFAQRSHHFEKVFLCTIHDVSLGREFVHLGESRGELKGSGSAWYRLHTRGEERE
jgi:hypothetical protein